MITKTELIKTIAKEENFTTSDVARIINKLTEIIAQKVAEGEMVNIKNFGTFRYRDKAERSGRNPQTGQPMIIEAHKMPCFRAGRKFRKIVNQ